MNVFVVIVEVYFFNGLFVFNIVGLFDVVICESKECVCSVILNFDYEFL